MAGSFLPSAAEVMHVLAAVLEEFGSPLAVRDLPEPVAGPGEALVEVLAAVVLPYTKDVFSGARRYPLEPPVVPGVGGVGRIVSVGPDATRIRPGELVWCDPTVRARDDDATPDITLQGWSSRGDGGRLLSRYFHDGAFAERMVVPLENVYPVGAGYDPSHWAGLAVPLVPLGGLTAIDLRPGETLLVSGATGNYGSSAVAVGLALGAGRVIAPGRNEKVLADLERRFGSRVVTVALSGDPDADTAAMQRAAGGPIDVVIDLLPPSAPTTAVRAAVMAVREQGRVVLMGGVGMLGGDDLSLPYPWLMRNLITVRGQWMCPRSSNRQAIALARSGLLDLGQDAVTAFPLEQINAAIEHAAEHAGPFERTVLVNAAG